MNQPYFLQFDAETPRPFPPPWACAWGDDQYGLWATAELIREKQRLPQRMRWIAPGQFTMGSHESETANEREQVIYIKERPQHSVTISTGFWLASTVCTQAQWELVMGGNPSLFHDKNQGSAQHPVESVSWNMVQMFLRQLEQLLPDCSATLATEAEWEYACRAGSQSAFSFGATITTEQVNYNGSYPFGTGSKGENRKHTVGVKDLPANPWGLYQMHGNVLEWCADAPRHYGHEPVVDPGLAEALTPTQGSFTSRVLRGGSWIDFARFARCASRHELSPEKQNGSTGFRIVLRNQ